MVELVTSLDAERVHSLYEAVRAEAGPGVTVVVATHDQALLSRLQPRVIALRNGELAAAA